MEIDGDRLLLAGRLDAYASALTLLSGRPIIARARAVPTRASLSYDGVALELSVAVLGNGLIALAARDRVQLEHAVRHFRERDPQNSPRAPAAAERSRSPKPSEVPHLGADGEQVKFQTHEHYVVQHKANISQGAIVVRSQPIPIGTTRRLALEIPTVQERPSFEATVSFLQDNIVGFAINGFAQVKEMLVRLTGAQPQPPSGPEARARASSSSSGALPAISHRGRLKRPEDLKPFFEFASMKPSSIDDCRGWFVRILEFLCRAVERSVVTFKQADTKLTLWIHSGRINFTRLAPTRDMELIGYKLVMDKRINRRTLDQALERQKTVKEPIGRTLVAMGAMLPAHLHAALRAQTMERIQELLEWSDGEVEVNSWSEPPISGDLVATQGANVISTLLKEHIRAAATGEVERFIGPYLDRHIKLDSTRLDALFQLQPKERRALEIAGSEHSSVRGFSTATGLSLPVAHRLILYCHALGAVELESAKS
jgi:hypothetical protein